MLLTRYTFLHFRGGRAGRAKYSGHEFGHCTRARSFSLMCNDQSMVDMKFRKGLEAYHIVDVVQGDGGRDVGGKAEFWR